MNKVKWVSLLIILIVGTFSAGGGVLADHDEEEKGEHSSNYEERDHRNDHYEDDDDDFYEEDDDNDHWDGTGGDVQSQIPPQTGYWNFWMREAVSTEGTQLPITTPTDVKITINGVANSIHAVPQDGQLLVPGEQFAKLISAKTNYYSKSKILVMTNNSSELIVRSGSNAAYENKNKVPMPIKTQYIEKSLYLPISVVANAMDYKVSWNEVEQSLILENL